MVDSVDNFFSFTNMSFDVFRELKTNSKACQYEKSKKNIFSSRMRVHFVLELLIQETLFWPKEGFKLDSNTTSAQEPGIFLHSIVI